MTGTGTRTALARRAGRLALVSLALFVLLAVWVTHGGDPRLPADTGPHRWSVAHRPPVASALARGVTDTGTGFIPYALLLAAGWYAGRTTRGRARTAAALLLCLGAGQALRYAAMVGIARPRPAAADWAVHASGWSFPSGHSATAAMTAGLLIAALVLRGPPVPRFPIVLIACWGAAVGLSRIYLGVHWPTDVLGGWLFATAWLSLLARAFLWRTGARNPAA
ncbi:phosphatase PAP2 family protein [Streptomyces sp. NPDC006529]|uniref:phosphatase PAP2 family protein n=1 Tax=Streptomyces sp. NPDC006529 TaxID=3157177 RepID=UPI0033B74074